MVSFRHFITRERAHHTSRIEGRVYPGAGLDVVVKRKISTLSEMKPQLPSLLLVTSLTELLRLIF
jgi:hypothetical protein